jgi:hypothetical protein
MLLAIANSAFNCCFSTPKSLLACVLCIIDKLSSSLICLNTFDNLVVFFVLVFVLYPIYLVRLGCSNAAEPSLIALVNVSTLLAALVNPNNFKPPDIILAAFQKLLKLVQGPNKTHT